MNRCLNDHFSYCDVLPVANWLTNALTDPDAVAVPHPQVNANGFCSLSTETCGHFLTFDQSIEHGRSIPQPIH